MMKSTQSKATPRNQLACVKHGSPVRASTYIPPVADSRGSEVDSERSLACDRCDRQASRVLVLHFLAALEMRSAPSSGSCLGRRTIPGEIARVNEIAKCSSTATRIHFKHEDEGASPKMAKRLERMLQPAAQTAD